MYGKMQESELTEIIPFICTLTIYYLLLSHPESPQDVLLEAAAVADGPKHTSFTEMAGDILCPQLCHQDVPYLSCTNFRVLLFFIFARERNKLLISFSFFWIFEFYLIYFFIQQVLISHQFYTHQCIHVNPNRPIQNTTIPTPQRFPPLVSIRLFSTSVSQLLPCKPVHLHHFSRLHIHALIYNISNF